MTTCRSYNHEQDYAWADDFLVPMMDVSSVSSVRPSFLGFPASCAHFAITRIL